MTEQSELRLDVRCSPQDVPAPTRFVVTAVGSDLVGITEDDLVYPDWPKGGVRVVAQSALALRGRIVG